MRRTLRRYTELIERQRQDLHRLRWEAIGDHVFPEELLHSCDEKIAVTVDRHGEELASQALGAIYARCLDEEWAHHLAWVDDVREGIHLRRLGKQDPLLDFIKDASGAFRERIAAATRAATNRFVALDIDRDLDALIRELRAPASTWTYLINDNPFPSFRMGLLGLDLAQGGAVGIGLMAFAPFLLLAGIVKPVARRVGRLLHRSHREETHPYNGS
jgi:preprotein translocase subunit SecA